MRSPHRLAVRALLTVALLSPSALRAQAGPWVPIGSRLDALAAWSIAEGALESIDPLTRPFRLAALRRAVELQDTLALAPAGRRAFGWVRQELDMLADSTAVSAELGLAGYRNGRRDSFREGGNAGGAAMGGLWVSLVRGPLVAVFNPAFENRLVDDPEYTGRTDRAIAGRLQTGYLAVTGTLGDLTFGRETSQWGPDLFDGLQLSPSAYPTDKLAATARIGRFALTTIAQRLDDAPPDSAAPTIPIGRYFFAHRLTIRAGRGHWIALTETGVYGGPGRSLELVFMAPLSPGLVAEVNEAKSVNLLWGAEAHLRVSRQVSLQFEAMVDDAQVDDSDIKDQRPTSGGYTIVALAALPAVPVHAALGFTRVASLTYRNATVPYTGYTLAGVGIGRNYSDYDQLALRLTARPSASARVALEASYLRQGSYDFRQPFPPDSLLAQPGHSILVAPVGHAAALRATLDVEPMPGVFVNGELGLNGRVSGDTEAIAAVAVRFRFDALRRRPGGSWPAIERGAARGWP